MLSEVHQMNLNLHDSLSVGEVEAGLSQLRSSSDRNCFFLGVHDNASQSHEKYNIVSSSHCEQIRHRLPLLLRVLQQARPLSSDVSVLTYNYHDNRLGQQPSFKSNNEKSWCSNAYISDPVIQGAVDRLEDITAMEPLAEGVEVIACHVAPRVCSLVHVEQNGADSPRLFTTTKTDLRQSTSEKLHQLLTILQTIRKRKSSKILFRRLVEDAEMEDNRISILWKSAGDRELCVSPNVWRSILSRNRGWPFNRFYAAGIGYSQEASMTRILRELIKLVLHSLKFQDKCTLLNDSYSFLCEGGTLSADNTPDHQENSDDGICTWNSMSLDLPTCVVSILHLVPVLRYFDVTRALCEARVVHAPSVIARLAANDPSGITSLIAGCIKAYEAPCADSQSYLYMNYTDSNSKSHSTLLTKSSLPFDNPNESNGSRSQIHATIEKSLMAIACLSPRECRRVQESLTNARILVGLQLQLTLLLLREEGHVKGEKNDMIAELTCMVLHQLPSTSCRYYSFIAQNGNCSDIAGLESSNSMEIAEVFEVDSPRLYNPRLCQDDDCGYVVQISDFSGCRPFNSQRVERGIGGTWARRKPLTHILWAHSLLMRDTIAAMRMYLNRYALNGYCGVDSTCFRDRRLKIWLHPPAQWSLAMCGFIRLFMFIPTDRLWETKGGPDCFTLCLKDLELYVLWYVKYLDEYERPPMDFCGENIYDHNPSHFNDNIDNQRHISCSGDRSLRLLIGAIFSALCSTFHGTHTQQETWRCECAKLLISIISNTRSRSFISCSMCCFNETVTRFLICIDHRNLTEWMEETLTGCYVALTSHASSIAPISSQACRFLCGMLPVDNGEDSVLSEIDGGSAGRMIKFDPASGIDLVRDNRLSIKFRLVQILASLSHVMTSTSYAKILLRHPHTPHFVEEATAFILHFSRSAGATSAAISPLQLEKLRSSISSLGHYDFEPISGDASRIIVCLLYYLIHADSNDPLSASKYLVFADVRSLPLIEIRCICFTPVNYGLSESLGLRLAMLIDQCCPEIRTKSFYRYYYSPLGSIRFRPIQVNSCDLYLALRRSADEPASDMLRLVAQKTFLCAKNRIPESILIPTTLRAFLTEQTLSFFTYPALCRDPLVFLKCPICGWHNKGIRRIILSILVSLLAANDEVVKKSILYGDVVKHEYIHSRNELLIRTLATLMSALSFPQRKELSTKCNSTCRVHCSLTIGFARTTVARHRGLLAPLFKRKLSNHTVDWMMEWVPECIEDTSSLYTAFTKRNSFGPLELLCVADGALRVALVYGGLGTGKVIKNLVSASLSQLISCFFLVVGPVGVPVNALDVGESGFDAINTSRKVAFRMLDILLRVPNIFCATIRGVCCLAIRNLQGFCQGESVFASLPGSQAIRQKNILKELMEDLTRVINYMGTPSAS